MGIRGSKKLEVVRMSHIDSPYDKFMAVTLKFSYTFLVPKDNFVIMMNRFGLRLKNYMLSFLDILTLESCQRPPALEFA